MNDRASRIPPADPGHPAGRPAGTDPGDVVPAVAAALRAELLRRRAEVAGIDGRLLPDIDRLIAFTGTGGKLIRPQFLCWGYLAGPREDGTAGRLPPAVIRAAASLELIQACALLHDDVIDRSDTRRGRPSTHRAVAADHAAAGWTGDSDHYGTSVALLLGDLALAWADDLFTAAAHELGALAAALPAWRAMRTEVLSGQLLDLRAAADRAADPVAQQADAVRVNLFKTAAYTVARPLHLGAALAGADQATVLALREYGTAVGLAFQLRDDLLGMFGDPVVTGKPAGGDLIEGKRTVLLALARKSATPTDRRELDEALGGPLTAAQVHRLTALVSATGAPGQVEASIDELVAQGEAALEARSSTGEPVLDPGVAEALREMAERATTRRH